MLTATAKFKAHIGASHTPRVRIGIHLPDGDGVYAPSGYLGVVEGQLTIDYGRNIRRQATVTVGSLLTLLDATYAAEFDSRDYLESLAGTNARATIEWGLLYPDGGEEWVTLATLRVEEFTSATLTPTVQVSAAYDDGSRVTDLYLVTPFTPWLDGVKMTYVEAIQYLVEEAFPSGAPPTWLIDPSVDDVSEPPDATVFQGQRWSALLALAQAINVTVGPDADGVWVIAPATDQREPVWTVASGPDGVLVDETTAYSRRDQFNAVAIKWEQPDGTGGTVYVTDDDPASPTYYDGPFGKKPRPVQTISTITSDEQATATARTLLQQYRGNTRSVAFTAVHNPLLEPGDVIGLYLPDGTSERHVIDSLTLPLTGGTMTAQTRILRGGITYDEPDVTYDDSRYTFAGVTV